MFNANKYTCKCWLLNIYEQVKGLQPELTAFANASKLEKLLETPYEVWLL